MNDVQREKGERGGRELVRAIKGDTRRAIHTFRTVNGTSVV